MNEWGHFLHPTKCLSLKRKISLLVFKPHQVVTFFITVCWTWPGSLGRYSQSVARQGRWTPGERAFTLCSEGNPQVGRLRGFHYTTQRYLGSHWVTGGTADQAWTKYEKCIHILCLTNCIHTLFELSVYTYPPDGFCMLINGFSCEVSIVIAAKL